MRPWAAMIAGCVSIILIVPVSARAASGQLQVSWENCGPIVTDQTATNGTMSIVVSVIGNNEAHVGYQVRFVLASASHVVPDAWRFDPEGCQGGSSDALLMNHLPPPALAESCPAFVQDVTPEPILLREYRLLTNNFDFAGTPARGLLAAAYPAGVTSDPARRYFLAEFRFDHLFSVAGPGTPGETCGGLETPLCIYLMHGYTHHTTGTTAFVRKSDNIEIPFDAPEPDYLTVNGMTGCPAVPAEEATWGQIKSVYRK